MTIKNKRIMELIQKEFEKESEKLAFITAIFSHVEGKDNYSLSELEKINEDFERGINNDNKAT